MQLRSLARNLAAAFARVPDPRPGPKRQYPLHSILALSALAALDGAFSARDITRWGKSIPDAVVDELGFPGEQIPAGDTLRRIVGRVDRAAVREALEGWSCSREDCPDWDRVSELRITSGEESSKSVLFDLDDSVSAGRHAGVSVLDQPRPPAAKVPPLRRWKRTRAVV